MFIDRDPYIDDENISDFISKYHSAKRSGNSVYFDIWQFEEIINYYLEEDKADIAAEIVEAALNQHPHSTELAIKKAEILFEQKEYSQAVEILNELVIIQPYDPEVFLLAGLTNVFTGECSLAEKHLDKCLNLSISNEYEVLLTISENLETEKFYSLAVKYYEKAYRINQNDPVLWYDLAYCYEKISKNKKSIRFYLKYLNEIPYSEHAWFNLGTVYNKKGLYEKAVNAFDYAIAINEGYDSAVFNKANALANAGKYKEAIRTYLDFLRKERNNADAFCYIGECYERLGQYKRAILYFKKAIRINYSMPDAWYGLGLIYFYTDQIYESYYHFKTAVQHNKREPEYWYALGKAASVINLIEEAMIAFNKATELDPYDNEFWISYSELLMDNQRVGEAIKVLSNGYEYIPESASINYHMAACLLKNNNTQRALQYFESGLTLDYNKHVEFFNIIPEAKKSDKIRKLIAKHKKC